MIVIFSEIVKKAGIKAVLEQQGRKVKFIDFSTMAGFSQVYALEGEVECVITEAQHPALDDKLWLDLIMSLSQRINILVIDSKKRVSEADREKIGVQVHWVESHLVEKILQTLEKPFQRRDFLKIKNGIPFYEAALYANHLKENGAVSVLSIDISSYKKISIDYGREAYEKLILCFEDVLKAILGSEGPFRQNDVLHKSPVSEDIFYVLLEKARSNIPVPRPGDLEKLADRLFVLVTDAMMNELFKPQKDKKIPSYVSELPLVSVGYSSVIYNPGFDSFELMDQLSKLTGETSKLQSTRSKERIRELMQTLIQTPKLLKPNYQAVFALEKLTNEDVLKSQNEKSIRPLESHLVSFESLIRINIPEFQYILGGTDYKHMDIKYLRPDTLFYLAEYVNLSLELDQACLRAAIDQFQEIPGELLVNILPRNFYNLDVIHKESPKHIRVTYEISEKEAINNYSLLSEVKKSVKSNNHRIAIDDFGIGYASMDRILRMEPDIIKLDRSLIENIHKDPSKKAFVEGLVNASKTTHSVILAEGVEEFVELEVLRELKVELVQGFLLHKPQDADAIRSDISHKVTTDRNTLKTAS